ncbi:MAG: prolipoprotein diacylglyceryl transferase, partial [Oscillospiraceae bacterium]|nr:prolipoprotein diacylglyceryl transferase [Oscillospiraceae bacterium]
MYNPSISFPLLGDFYLDIPRFFTVFGFRIHFYGVILALGLVAGAIYALKRAPQFGLTQDNILDYLLFAIPSAILFSRLYYAVFNWDYYGQN